MTEKKGDTAVFTFGRFNPPTVGHEKLITSVQNVSRTSGGDFFVYPSHSQDSKKNPLDQSTKIRYMKKMFPKFKNNIIKSLGKTALEIASEIYDKAVWDFKQRLKNINWKKFYQENPFKLSCDALYHWSPIADEL